MDIPKNRKQRSAVRLCAMLAVMALLFLMIADDFGAMARALNAQD